MMRFGTLHVMTLPFFEKGYRKTICYCEACHEHHLIYWDNLVARKTTTCKCQRAIKYNAPRKLVKKLGQKWWARHQLCNKPGSSKHYKNYGGRGIQLKFTRTEWIEFFIENFDWYELMHKDIDRIDNDGHYEPGNLRLVTRSENLKNRRSSRC